jgi:K+-sensing histidine kinase KdpD
VRDDTPERQSLQWSVVPALFKGHHLQWPPSPARDRIVEAVSIALLLLIGWLDYATGYEFGFFIFYFIPVAISAWFVGRRAGFFMAVASAIVWYLSDKYTHHPYSNAIFIYWEMFMRLVSFLTTALTIASIRQMLINERRLSERLEQALTELAELKGGRSPGNDL